MSYDTLKLLRLQQKNVLEKLVNIESLLNEPSTTEKINELRQLALAICTNASMTRAQKDNKLAELGNKRRSLEALPERQSRKELIRLRNNARDRLDLISREITSLCQTAR